jgi:hypothetical protein
MEIQQPFTRESGDNNSEFVFKLRNDFIKIFLDERYLQEHFQKNFKLAELSKVKIEFIKRDLKMLLTSSIDEELYLSIIAEIKNNDPNELKPAHESIFLGQVNSLLKKYIY